MEDEDRGPNARYEMFSRAGNDACEAMVAQLVVDVDLGEVTSLTLRPEIARRCKAVVAAGFDEVWDTEPQWQISDEVSKRVCVPQRWEPVSRDW